MMLRLFVFLLMSFAASMISYGQIGKKIADKEDTNYRNILKVGVLSPFWGAITIQYEIKHTPNVSSQLEFFYFYGFFFGEPTGYRGAGVTYNYRFYTKGDYADGFYVQPYGRIQKYDYVGTQNPTSPGVGGGYEHVSIFGLGMVFGYQKFFTKHFSYDLCAGPNYNFGYADGVRTSSFEFWPPMNGGWIRVGTSIGYAF